MEACNGFGNERKQVEAVLRLVHGLENSVSILTNDCIDEPNKTFSDKKLAKQTIKSLLLYSQKISTLVTGNDEIEGRGADKDQLQALKGLDALPLATMNKESIQALKNNLESLRQLYEKKSKELRLIGETLKNSQIQTKPALNTTLGQDKSCVTPANFMEYSPGLSAVSKINMLEVEPSSKPETQGLANHRSKGCSLSAFKSHNSYFLIKSGAGYILVDNGKKIHSQVYGQQAKQFIFDVAFASDAYFIYQTPGIYIKKIDKQEPELWIKASLKESYGKALKATPDKSALISNYGKSLEVTEIDPVKKSAGSSTKIATGRITGSIKDFSGLGYRGHRAVVLIDHVWMQLYVLNNADHKNEYSLVERIYLYPDPEVRKSCDACRVSVCPESRFFVVASNKARYYSMNLIQVFELDLVGCFKLRYQGKDPVTKLSSPLAISFLGYLEDSLVMSILGQTDRAFSLKTHALRLNTEGSDDKASHLRMEPLPWLTSQIAGDKFHKVDSLDGSLMLCDNKCNIIRFRYKSVLSNSDNKN